ncbi:SRPBCC family protein [Sphingomonas psychrotolerans]|uniref:ATPase n=1 Tax=Sphingomonas psychrotolerans TaxID=1327635 RepID=A0A2K8MCD9_9SPHN|nr:SRPBCC family protein [Sphingomonas psychrotolerans]ATY31555.1 ATPase [Sphingomonas psychrotolerans]
MSPQPTGHVVGNDLILTRIFRAPIDDVWTSVTTSESTARWFGPWEGDAGPGKIVRLQLVHEKDQPWAEVTIEECEAPRLLVLTMNDEFGAWRIEMTLTQTDDMTELRFVQHLSDRKLAGDVGPGWEYYLDMLVAAREGKTLPSFEDYYPAQKEYYLKGA